MANRHLSYKWIIWVLITKLLMVLFLSGCSKETFNINAAQVTPSATTPFSEINIPFTVIEISGDMRLIVRPGPLPGSYQGEDPALFIIASDKEKNEIFDYVSQSAQDKLNKIDFSKDFVIGVFLGEKSTGGYKVEIQSITRVNNTIIIQADLNIPQPDTGRATIGTSPYELISIHKPDNIGGNIDFKLLGTTTIEESHFIP